MRLILVLFVQAAITFVGSSSSRKPLKRLRTAEDQDTDAPNPLESWKFPLPVALGVNITGLSAQYRLIEQYDYERIAATFGVETIPTLRLQRALDHRHDFFTPSTRTENMSENTPYGKLTVGDMVSQSTQSAVFTLVELPDLLIKYETNCLEVLYNHLIDHPVVHPLIFDHLYGTEAASWELSLSPLFVSPPTVLCPNKKRICSFGGISTSEYDLCLSKGASVRYMLFQKPKGQSLREAATNMGGVMPFRTVMLVGVAMMELLKSLHLDAQIVHGTVSENNVYFEPVASKPIGNYELRLLDYGRAARIVDSFQESPTIRNNGRDHFLYTQWMIDGYQLAPRDDVMKTIQMLTHLMHDPAEYRPIEEHYMRLGYEAQHGFKMELDIFFPVVPWNPGQRLDALDSLTINNTVKGRIRRELSSILEIVRSLRSPNAEVPYDSLRAAFYKCANLTT